MPRKLIVLVFFGIVLLVGAGLAISYFSSKNSTEPQEIGQEEGASAENTDFTASFEIYTNGTLRNFSAKMYHNLSPDVYIESKNSSLIRVKKKGVTWGDFFDTLPMELTHECLTTGTGERFCTGSKGELTFQINGVKVDNFLDRVINEDEKATTKYTSR